jgi:hypothetical protein
MLMLFIIFLSMFHKAKSHPHLIAKETATLGCGHSNQAIVSLAERVLGLVVAAKQKGKAGYFSP